MNGLKKDIESRDDIERLVNTFYEQAIANEKIGYFFTQVVTLDWQKHIPTICDFWETTLLGKIKYKGNPMLKHIELNKLSPLRPEHFEEWVTIWQQTVNQLFEGRKAQEANQRAENISKIMQFKILEVS